MRKKINRICVIFFLLIIIFKIATFHAYSRIYANWRECVNIPDCVSGALTSSFKIYIVEHAGYFLTSHSSYQAFLSRVEISETNGIDYTELRETLYGAIENMEKAKMAYANFKVAAEKISYSTDVIDKLLKFDYEGFQIKYGLIKPIFEKVKILLGNADISGLDTAILSNMDTILKQLYEVKAIVDKNQSPDISILWRLNQYYAEAQLFGQYVSEVFKANL